MISNALNESISSYSEGTPIVNKIDHNFEYFSQMTLNNMLTSPKNDRKLPKNENENQQLQSQKTIKLEKKQTLAIASEETLILPNTKRPIRIYTIYDKDKMQINNEGETQIQKEINNLKQSKLDRKSNYYDHYSHHQQQQQQQPVPHPSLPTKIKRSLSGDIVKYKPLLQVLDEEYRAQQLQDQIPTIMIASGLTQSTDGRRKSQLISFPRKNKKDGNPLAQKFLIMRQQRKKKKQNRKLRRKSCTCHECGGAASSYQVKYNDIDIDTAMSRKIKLANLVIENLKFISKESKNLSLKKEKQMNVLKAALEKTFLEQLENNGQQTLSDQKGGGEQQFQQEVAKFDRKVVRIQTNIKQTYIGDSSPDKQTQTPGSRLTEQDYKERLTQTDLDNYKFNRNKSNYSRANENIKKMRNTMINYNIIESLSNINDESQIQKSQRYIHKNGTLSLKNLSTLDTRQSPEKRSYPYKLKERNQGSMQFKQLPPKIIPRKDLQNLFFKQSNAFEKIIDNIDTQETQRSNKYIHLNTNQIAKNAPNSCIDLCGSTQQFFQSVMQQRMYRTNNNLSEVQLKVPLTSSSSKYSFNTPLKQTNYQSNLNGYEPSNIFFNTSKEVNITKSSLSNPYTKSRMTPLRSRTPHQLPQIEILSATSRK